VSSTLKTRGFFSTRNLLPFGATLNLHIPASINGAKRSLSSCIDASRQRLPNDVHAFKKKLEDYVATKGTGTQFNKNKNNTQLKQLITKYREHPNTCLLLLQKSLNFEKKHPEARGLVDEQTIFYVLQNFVIGGQVEKADKLLTICQSLDSIQLSPKCYGIVMNGYAKQKSRESLKRIEDLLNILEEARLQGSSFVITPLNCYTYNILMNAYVGVLGKQSANAVQQTIERMRNISVRLKDNSLRPNLACYTTLMKAYMLERQPGFALKVNAVLDEMKLDKYYLEQPAKERMYLDSMAIDAWSKSGDAQAILRARQIFDAIDQPNTVIYSTLCNIYAGVGDVDEVFRLYEDMQSDFNSVKNKGCQPNMHTYSTILNALQKSNRPDAIEKAEQIFSAIPLPDTVAYSTFINILAKKGDVEKALDLLQRMQSHFEAGINKDCRPDMHTYNAMLNVLQKSNRPDAAVIAEQIFNGAHSPDTITYNLLINILAKNGDVEKALAFLQRMKTAHESRKNNGCRPDMQTYNAILNVLQKSNRPDAAEIAEQIFNGIHSPNTIIYNTLISIYARRDSIENALNRFQQMQWDSQSGMNKNCRPDMHTYSIILNALRLSDRSDAVQKAEQIFGSIPSPNTVTYNSLINLYAQKGEVDKALNLLHQMQSYFDSGHSNNCCPDMHTYSSILNALRLSDRSDAVQKAEQIFGSIPSPSAVAYNSLINVYAQNREVDKALGLLDRMLVDFESGQNQDCRPNMRTYSTVLNALLKSNRSDAVDRAEQIFSSIPLPDTVAFNTMINLYAERGMGTQAVSIVRRMQSDFKSGTNRSCVPNEVTKSTLLKALHITNDSEVKSGAKIVLNWFYKKKRRMKP
jgi:pentatricopeptide repeat protein